MPAALLRGDRLVISAHHIGGFVAAEGCFTGHRNSFVFTLALGARDAAMCHVVADVFGCGRVRWYARRRPHYDDEVCFQVRRLADLVEVVVPFMDEHLPPSHKREQYRVWRAELLDYWQRRAKRRRPCTMEGCDAPQRAKGLCRVHYYAAYGK